MYKHWLRRLESLLILGSLLTMAGGAALFFWPARLCGLLGLLGADGSISEIGDAMFVRFTAMLIFLLGAAYALALLNRAKNKAIFWLAGIEKTLASALMAAYAVIRPLTWAAWAVVVMDLSLAVLFFVYLKMYREDNWL